MKIEIEINDEHFLDKLLCGSDEAWRLRFIFDINLLVRAKYQEIALKKVKKMGLKFGDWVSYKDSKSVWRITEKTDLESESLIDIEKVSDKLAKALTKELWNPTESPGK